MINKGEVDIGSAYPHVSNRTLAEVPEIKRILTAKGITLRADDLKTTCKRAEGSADLPETVGRLADPEAPAPPAPGRLLISWPIGVGKSHNIDDVIEEAVKAAL